MLRLGFAVVSVLTLIVVGTVEQANAIPNCDGGQHVMPCINLPNVIDHNIYEGQIMRGPDIVARPGITCAGSFNATCSTKTQETIPATTHKRTVSRGSS